MQKVKLYTNDLMLLGMKVQAPALRALILTFLNTCIKSYVRLVQVISLCNWNVEAARLETPLQIENYVGVMYPSELCGLTGL